MDLLRSCDTGDTACSMQWTAFATTSGGTVRALGAFNTPGLVAGSGNRLGDAIMACSNGTVLTKWRSHSGWLKRLA
ncbi:hypothetical protein SAMN05414139_03184 [Burkholderia sp. D7]|nr:hypothetical protein SAMN05414139_03184 [Burkholderia sp. D7]